MDRQTRFCNPHMKTCRHKKKISSQSSKLVVSCRSLYASIDDGMNNEQTEQKSVVVAVDKINSSLQIL